MLCVKVYINVLSKSHITKKKKYKKMETISFRKFIFYVHELKETELSVGYLYWMCMFESIN